MKPILVMAVALMLAGCDTGSGWIPHSDAEASPPMRESSTLPPASPAPIYEQAPRMTQRASNQPTPTAEAHCRAVAHQRASDARANGYSLDMERTIFDGTYKDCLAWDSGHGE